MHQQVTTQCGFPEPKKRENEVGCAIKNCIHRDMADCCIFENSTTIDSPDFLISNAHDYEVLNLFIGGSSDVSFLPIYVNFKFPNLGTYHADHCNIGEISSMNFANLTKIREISLAGNRIEMVLKNTFEGLVLLEKINLSGFKTILSSILYLISFPAFIPDDNQIKQMNARVFEILPVLNTVNLTNNQCIDNFFEGPEDMKILPKSVTEACVFTETSGLRFNKLFNITCGNIFLTDGLIHGGNETKQGQWPFLAGILKKSSRKFFCGGSIITNKHVLTAAHCVETKKSDQGKSRKQLAVDIVVYLGRHSLTSTTEINSVTRNVAKIIVHHDWNTGDVKYDADLAILALEQEVAFSNFIQPVCLTDETKIAEYEDGYVVSLEILDIGVA